MVTFDVEISRRQPSELGRGVPPPMHLCVQREAEDSSSESGSASRLQFLFDMVPFFARSSSHTLPLCLEAVSATHTRQIMENESKRRTPRGQKPNAEIDEGAAM